MATNPYILLLLALVFVGTNVDVTQGHPSFIKKWFNPWQWKEYWKRYNLRHTVRKPHEVKSDQSVLKGPNVCSYKVPVIVSRRCHVLPGYGGRPCRTQRYYVTEYKCCAGFAQVQGQSGCPKALYTSKQNIVELAKSLGLSTLVQLVTAANLGDALIRPSATFTIFAPNNEAFAKVPKETLDNLLRDRKALADLLLFHVASGRFPAQSLKNNQRISTLNSPNKLLVNVAEEPKTVIVQGARVTLANQGASNGIIHVVDKVLQPASGSTIQYLESKEKYGIFTEMVQWTGLDLRNTTMFVPPDQAFKAWAPGRLETLSRERTCVARLVRYHVVDKPLYSGVLSEGRLSTKEGTHLDVRIEPGTKAVMINDAKVTKADVSTTDGVVHVIDRVLMPLSALDVVEAAQSLGLTELVKNLESTGLAESLRNVNQPLTLFAPTNEAFQALPASVKAQLQRDPALLANILRYHVAPGKLYTYRFGKDMLVDSLRPNAKLRLNNFRYGKVHSVDGVCIKQSNIATCNSVIHVIPKILTTPTQSLYEAISTNNQLKTLTRAVDAAGLRPVLNNPNVSLTVFAPTDAAFMAVDSLDEVLKNPQQLLRLLKFHVLNGTIYSCGLDCKYSYWSLFSPNLNLMSLNQGILRLRLAPYDNYYVNGAKVLMKDISATNGVLNIIDRVLQPRTRESYVQRKRPGHRQRSQHQSHHHRRQYRHQYRRQNRLRYRRYRRQHRRQQYRWGRRG